jgi:hypothetical protein
LGLLTRRKAAASFVFLLSLSLLFALMAHASPMKSLPSPPACLKAEVPSHACGTLAAKVESESEADALPGGGFWLYQSSAEIAEGFAIMAVLSFSLTFKRPAFPWLSKPVAPRLPGRLATALALVGASAFAFLALVDSTYYDLAFSRSFIGLFHRWHFSVIPIQGSGFGVLVLGVWGLTVLCLSLHRGLLGGVKTFGLPAILFLMLALLAFDPKEMVIHVTLLTAWSVDGVAVLSNWVVLMVASFLTASAFTRSLSRRVSRR